MKETQIQYSWKKHMTDVEVKQNIAQSNSANAS